MRKALLAIGFIATLPVMAHAQGVSDGTMITDGLDIRSIEGVVNAEEVSALIDGSADTANALRMLVEPAGVTIVKLGERRNAVTDDIETTLADADSQLADLRNAIQINAVLTEVLNQQTVGVTEVIGANVTDGDEIVVYAFAAHGDN